jgi:hypothetical protein
LLFMQMVGSTFAGITFVFRKRVRHFFERFGRRSSKKDTELANR